MGQKINPTGLRIGVIKDWESRWYAGKGEFGDTLVSDHKLREYLLKNLAAAGVPKVEIERPDRVIGTNTVTNMQSGIFYGFAGLVEYIVKKIKREMKSDCVKTVATGGFSEIIAGEISCIDYVDKLLTLEGLKYLYYLNSTEE